MSNFPARSFGTTFRCPCFAPHETGTADNSSLESAAFAFHMGLEDPGESTGRASRVFLSPENKGIRASGSLFQPLTEATPKHAGVLRSPTRGPALTPERVLFWKEQSF
jgi:hypothetical protein